MIRNINIYNLVLENELFHQDFFISGSTDP